MLIEDNAFTRKVISETLRNIGIEIVTPAQNGIAGLQALRKSRHNFDLIICDLEMPEMGGMEFITAVRTEEDIPNAAVPIIVLTGLAEMDTLHKALLLGINGYLVKPVSKTNLESKIVSAISNPIIDPKNIG